jgi:ABC-type bacteriocin/lantibiotic exporter with double-glycine peptidase domain
MLSKIAKAIVPIIRQQTQFTCSAVSISACLQFFDKPYNEDDVNRVLKCVPKKGASWEEILLCLQYFGMKGELIVPCNFKILKEWTDNGNPAIIGWNPQGRPWSHASVVCDVSKSKGILIMDPNSVNTDKTLKWWSFDDFSDRWYEKSGDFVVRRPALKVSKEVGVNGELL